MTQKMAYMPPGGRKRPFSNMAAATMEQNSHTHNILRFKVKCEFMVSVCFSSVF